MLVLVKTFIVFFITSHQQRIHHYRILPNDDNSLSVQVRTIVICIINFIAWFAILQAQEGVQQKRFQSLDGLVDFYSQPKRGIVCGLTTPIEPNLIHEDQPENDDDDDDDDGLF